MLLEVLNNIVTAFFLITCHLFRDGIRSSQVVSITKFVVVSSVGIMRGLFNANFKHFSTIPFRFLSFTYLIQI